MKYYEKIREKMWLEVQGFELNSDYISSTSIELYERQASKKEAETIFRERAKIIRERWNQLINDYNRIEYQIRERKKHKQKVDTLWYEWRTLTIKQDVERIARMEGWTDVDYSSLGTAEMEID